jgi:fumarate hydratase subunit alpha
MKVIQYPDIVAAVKKMCIDAAHKMPEDILERIKEAYVNEPFPRAKIVLERIIENAKLADMMGIPICQDTGYAIYFVKIGADIKIEGGTLYDAINKGTQLGYVEGYLRGSIVDDPVFDRKNTENNTPAIVHVELTGGDKLEISLMPKGGGCENMSALAMLKPSDGLTGIMKFVKDTVVNAGGSSCPPVVVGVGIGGTADTACALAKKALLRPVGEHHQDKNYAQLEIDLKDEINASGVGPQGLGGLSTTLWVSVEHTPCHIASMPIAVNIGCHAARLSTVTL